MEITKETRLVGGMGTKYLSGTSNNTGLTHTTIEANEDCAFTSITGADVDGNVVNLLTAFNMSGVTLKEGKMLYCSLNYTITAVQLASGTIFVH